MHRPSVRRYTRRVYVAGTGETLRAARRDRNTISNRDGRVPVTLYTTDAVTLWRRINRAYPTPAGRETTFAIARVRVIRASSLSRDDGEGTVSRPYHPRRARPHAASAGSSENRRNKMVSFVRNFIFIYKFIYFLSSVNNPICSDRLHTMAFPPRIFEIIHISVFFFFFF